MSNKKPNMISSICSMCIYYVKYLDKDAIYCDKKADSNCFLSLAEKICTLVKEGYTEKERTIMRENKEKTTEVNMNPKSCDNCGYSFIKANDSVQCYNPYTDFFSKLSHSPCDFWNKNKGLAIKTIAETRLCKNCKHLLIYNNDLYECECTNRTTLPLHSCQLWEGVI